jgi:hypothetical protein
MGEEMLSQNINSAFRVPRLKSSEKQECCKFHLKGLKPFLTL